MSLLNAQVEFAESIFTNDADDEWLHPSINLKIYRNNITTTLVNTLLNIYQKIHQLVGDDFFRQLAKEYIQRYPSHSANLHDYGQYFGDFITDYTPAKQLAYLPDVAKFEWAAHTLQFAAEHPPFDVSALEKISPEKYDHLHFNLNPASVLMHFHFPVSRIIALCNSNAHDPIQLDDEGEYILMIRRDFNITFDYLTEAEFTFLQLLHDNETLEDALGAALGIDPAFKLEEKLPFWIANKTLVDC